MRLLLFHPKVATRDCRHCLKYVYNEDTGKPFLRGGQLVPRPKGTLPPCGYKRPDGKSACAKERPFNDLLPENRLAYSHYLECSATGIFPDDPIVKRNAALIREMEKIAEAKWNAELAGARFGANRRSAL